MPKNERVGVLKKSIPMNRIKLFTFKLMLLFLTTTLFVNCEKDTSLEIQEEIFEEAKVAPFSSRLVYSNEIENDPIIRERLRALQTNRSNASFESDTNFTIHTSTAKYIEKTDGSRYSYTFAVDRDGVTYTEVENLVLSVNTDTQELTTVFFTYHYTSTQLQELVNTGHVSTHTEMTVIPIEGDFSSLITEFNSSPCTVSVTTYHITPDGSGTFEHGQGSSCQHLDSNGEPECEVYHVTTIWCPPTSQGGSSTTTTTTSGTQNTTPLGDPSNNTTSGGTTTSTNQNNNNDTDEIVTTPVYENRDCIIINNNFNIVCDELLDFEQDYKDRMTAAEIAIFENLSRVQQLSYLLNAKNAISKSQELYPDTLHNGIGDAFRHAYWNALNVIDLGLVITQQLTTAHEDRLPSYAFGNMETQMDLFNNEIGRNIGLQIGDGSFMSVEDAVVQAVNNGNLRHLNNLNQSNQATANSQLIPTNQ